MTKPRYHLDHGWGTYCGRKAPKLTTDDASHPEICQACAQADYESWRDTMNDIFEHGGSDSERELFEPMGIGNWNGRY